MKTRYGCLGALFIVAAVGAYGSLTSTADDEGYGRLFFFLAFGLMLLYLLSFIEWLTTRPKIEQRGFPVIPLPPRPPDDER
jgi:hypothetical protein